MEFGYVRISSKKQSIERQIRNIKIEYPSAMIFKEVYTGSKIDGRVEFNKLLKIVKCGDVIIFDSVSRMSRDSKIGFELYKKLFDAGVELVFLKEPYINTSVYRQAINNKINMTGTEVDDILIGINKYLMRLAENQIKIAFEQAEKEVEDLRQRTREGLLTAKLNGKQVGGIQGKKLITKKSVEVKKQIVKYSKDFKGNLSDVDVMKLIGVARNTYYKYKKELQLELQINNNVEF